MHNLAGKGEYEEIRKEHADALMNKLRKTSDPRVTGGNPDVFESHIRYSHIRTFPEPDWLEK